MNTGTVCFSDCDTSFLLCLRSGETSHDILGCSIGSIDLGSIGGDNVTFTNAVGNRENPLVNYISILPTVRFLECSCLAANVYYVSHLVYMCPMITQNGYQLVIESFTDSRILVIDFIFIEIPASTLGESSPPQLYSGDFQEQPPVTINLSYSLGCSPNYTLCTVSTILQCVPEDECINGKSCSLLGSHNPSQECMFIPLH